MPGPTWSKIKDKMADRASSPPSHILIIGAGVFGLSTALALLKRPLYSSSRITILDASPSLPNPFGSSVDSSRIVRADYASKPYAALVLAAQQLWRDTSDEGWGGQGRYHEPGYVLTADAGAEDYVLQSLQNVKSLAEQEGEEGTVRKKIDGAKIEELSDRDAIKRATGYDEVSGDSGYANWNSGWADAEASVAYALRRVQNEGQDRVQVRSGCPIEELLFDAAAKCIGAEIEGGEQVLADLTILAAGAWSPSLVDLQGRCLATGQAMAYLDISEEEQQALGGRPTVMNMSRGMFIIPPRGQKLKVARHGFGYRNPVRVRRRPNDQSQPQREDDEVSVPKVGISIPAEAEEACRQFLRELVPHMADRPFARTRVCWYCDT